jgi:beta-phosphoglucomutase-like phosphatase (HAD superfamily)
VRELSGILPLAICSGALASDIEPILRILDIESCFSVKVTADQVKVSKPDPESYLVAFARLREKFPARVADPSSCIAIEDTPAGITAATGAGLKVLAITNTYKAEYLEEATGVEHSLENVSAGYLDQLISKK